MKKIQLLMVALLVSCSVFAGKIDVVEGNSKFLKSEGVMKVIIDWSDAKYAEKETLKEAWNKDKQEYDSYVEKGEKSLLEGFNKSSKKLKASKDAENPDYTMLIKITNVDYFFSVMSIVPGHKFTVWAEITVKDKNGNVVCKAKANRFKGGRDFVRDDAYTEMMRDFGKELSSL